MLFFLRVFILCFYVGTRPARGSFAFTIHKTPPSAHRRTPRWRPNLSPYFQDSSSKKVLTPPTDLGCPGDDSLPLSQSAKVGKAYKSPLSSSCVSQLQLPQTFAASSLINLRIELRTRWVGTGNWGNVARIGEIVTMMSLLSQRQWSQSSERLCSRQWCQQDYHSCNDATIKQKEMN